MRHAACALVLSLSSLSGLLSLPALAQTEQPTDAPAQVIVEGRRPGPGLWKVSKGEHVMWIFGLYSPLPTKMEWDDARARRLVKGSQEVLQQPGFQAGVSGIKGFFEGLIALPSLIGVENNPDGATLQDVLPADVYARWFTLKAKYIGDDKSVERLRPIFAAERLKRAGFDKNGLSGSNVIEARIAQIAKDNKVRQTSTGVGVQVSNLRQLVKDFKASQIQDLACFTKTLDHIDDDIAATRAKANAWANGNIDEIKSLDFAEVDVACDDAVMNNPVIKKAAGIDDVVARVREAWMQSAEKALEHNASTFAMLQMKDILGPDGALAALQAKGYTVESPK